MKKRAKKTRTVRGRDVHLEISMSSKARAEDLAAAVGVPFPKEVKREPVDFDFTALNWDFLKGMAWIPLHAREKYGSWQQYRDARLRGEKSPVNHAIEHLAKYLKGEPYDKRDGSVRWHLVAAAYNCMMEFYYEARWGHEAHPLVVEEKP